MHYSESIRGNRINFVFWLYGILLVYIIAALAWWYIALMDQTYQMISWKLSSLNPKATDFLIQKTALLELRHRKEWQYGGEGSTFLVMILIGAAFVYRSLRKEFRLSDQQQNFMMAVTHELKTPIAVIHLNLETLERHNLENTKRHLIIEATLEETERLDRLSSNILLASKLASGHYEAKLKKLNFTEVAEKCIKNFAVRYPDRIVSLAPQPQVYIPGEPFLLSMLINNLIENALKYAPENTSVTFRFETENNQLRFSVKDLGIGIPHEERNKIFRKFYRLGDENVRRYKGTGLGLYLCWYIVKLHHGHIGISDNHPNGSIFTIVFNEI